MALLLLCRILAMRKVWLRQFKRSRLSVPVLVHAEPDIMKQDGCCLPVVIHSVARSASATIYARPASLLHWQVPYSCSWFPEFQKDLDDFASVCRIVKGLINVRFGAIGARPAAFNTVRYSEKLLERAGVAIEVLDLSEILGRVGRLADNEAAVKTKLNAIGDILIPRILL